MGQGYNLKCSTCDYRISVTEGIGMAYSSNAVFYGRCDDPTQNWSIAFPDGYCEGGKPLLSKLVKSKKIRNKAFELLASAAVPDEYGHELYICSKCLLLSNRFYFRLLHENGDYEPDYKCPHCKTSLRRVAIKTKTDGTVDIVYTNHRKAEWKCPDCGGNKLELDGMMLWD